VDFLGACFLVLLKKIPRGSLTSGAEFSHKLLPPIFENVSTTTNLKMLTSAKFENAYSCAVMIGRKQSIDLTLFCTYLAVLPRVTMF
jgi:hypothetical protein